MYVNIGKLSTGFWGLCILRGENLYLLKNFQVGWKEGKEKKRRSYQMGVKVRCLGNVGRKDRSSKSVK